MSRGANDTCLVSSPLPGRPVAGLLRRFRGTATQLGQKRNRRRLRMKSEIEGSEANLRKLLSFLLYDVQELEALRLKKPLRP